MFKNYFKIAWRNILRNKSHAALNIIGLAVGIGAALLIFIVVKYELSFDTFQKNYPRTYRIVTATVNKDGSQDFNSGIPCPAYDALRNAFPQLDNIVALNASTHNQFTVLGKNPNAPVTDSKKFEEPGTIVFTSPAYFNIFNANWLTGNPAALKDPGNIILDQSTATRFFGDWRTAEGQFLKLDNHTVLKVTGVVEDMPGNSDFQVKAFLSYELFKSSGDIYNYSPEWGSVSSNHQIYITLPTANKPKNFETQLDNFSKKHFNNRTPIGRHLNLQPMRDFHFDSRYPSLGEHSTSRPVLWTLTFIGILIIAMASINFINLSTAQAVARSKEAGIRKVLGGSRRQLVMQLLGETFLIVLLAVAAAALLAKLAAPWLYLVANTPAAMPVFSLPAVSFLLLTLVLVTLLSGIYPALIVSGFKPVLALKSKINAASVGGISLRRVLVVTQFAIAQILIIGTIIAVSQMNYIRNADLGFNKQAVMVVSLNPDSLNLQRLASFKSELLKNTGIGSISYASDEASSENNWSSNFAFNHNSDAPFPVFSKYADHDYLKTFELQLVAGRGYSASDTVREYVINETLVKKLGIKNPKEAIGKDLQIGGGGWFPVVGVVKDFKINSLKEEIKPLTIAPYKSFYYTINIKLKAQQWSRTIAAIQSAWENTFPEYAFSSHFSDETVDRFYQQENKLASLYKFFAGVAIFISCLGLYGLVSYMAVQKTKEVGIRKVLGASVRSIVVLFSKEFTLLILIAFLVAAPIGWYVMYHWLQNFVYRTNISLSIFFLAILISLVLAWCTVGLKAIKAGLANPVRSLRNE